MARMTNEEAVSIFERDMKRIEAITEGKLSDPDPRVRMRAAAMKGYGHECQKWVGRMVAELDKERDPAKRNEDGRLLIRTVGQIWALVASALITSATSNSEDAVDFASIVIQDAGNDLAQQIARAVLVGGGGVQQK